jgi:hypothetical protein
VAWLWDSYEEFRNNVNPVMIDHEGPLRAARFETLCEQQAKIGKALAELDETRTKLGKLGFTDDPPREDRDNLGEAHSLCLEAAYAGEELLLYHRRLALSRSSYNFCHQKDIVEHENWDRYSATNRIFHEIAKLVEAVDELVQGYHDLVTLDSEYLSIDRDFPDAVLVDFRLARDLLSVGADEIGLLIAGRGLEGVLRHIAKDRRVILEDRGKAAPASEVDFYHLIEAFGRLRWRGTGVPLLDKDAVALLHYLRSIRNAGAHPVVGGGRKNESAREIAKVTVEKAGSLWKDASKAGARLVSTKVKRTW